MWTQYDTTKRIPRGSLVLRNDWTNGTPPPIALTREWKLININQLTYPWSMKTPQEFREILRIVCTKNMSCYANYPNRSEENLANVRTNGYWKGGRVRGSVMRSWRDFGRCHDYTQTLFNHKGPHHFAHYYARFRHATLPLLSRPWD